MVKGEDERGNKKKLKKEEREKGGENDESGGEGKSAITYTTPLDPL